MTDTIVASASAVCAFESVSTQRAVGSVVRLAPWSVPVSGIRMPIPAHRTATAVDATSATRAVAANAMTVATGNTSKDAHGKDAKGDEAFEDPV